MTYTPERIAGDGILTKEEYESALSDFKHEPYEYWRLAKLKRHDEALRSEIERLTARLAEAENALRTMVEFAKEAHQEWDSDNDDSRAGKMLFAMAGGIRGYRPETEKVHELLATLNIGGTD